MDSLPNNEPPILKLKSSIDKTKEDLTQQTKDLQLLVNEVVGNKWVPDDAIFFLTRFNDWTSQLLSSLSRMGDIANQLSIEDEKE